MSTAAAVFTLAALISGQFYKYPDDVNYVLDFEHIKFDDGRICALALDDFGGHVSCKGDPDPEGRPLNFAGKSPHDRGISLVIYGSSVWYLDDPHCVIPHAPD